MDNLSNIKLAIVIFILVIVAGIVGVGFFYVQGKSSNLDMQIEPVETVRLGLLQTPGLKTVVAGSSIAGFKMHVGKQGALDKELKRLAIFEKGVMFPSSEGVMENFVPNLVAIELTEEPQPLYEWYYEENKDAGVVTSSGLYKQGSTLLIKIYLNKQLVLEGESDTESLSWRASEILWETIEGLAIYRDTEGSTALNKGRIIDDLYQKLQQISETGNIENYLVVVKKTG